MSDLDWERFLIRDEFFNLYFEHFDISERLHVERLTDIYEITRNKKPINFHFGIIRYRLDDMKIDSLDIRPEEDEKKRREYYEIYKRHELTLIHPSEPQSAKDESMNFLSMTFTGFANINPKQTKLFVKKEDDSNYMLSLFKEIRDKDPKNQYTENNEVNLEYYSDIIRDRDYFLKRNQQLNQKHNAIIKKILENHLDNIPKIKKETNEYFSLFFFKDSTLFEFRGHENSIRIVKSNITNSSIRSILLENILSPKGREIKYENDLTIFSEMEDQVNDDVNLSSEGVSVIILISILFIINFFITNPENIFYDYSTSVSDRFEKNISTNEYYLDKIQNLSQAFFFLSDSILPQLFNNNTHYNEIISFYGSQLLDKTVPPPKLALGNLSYYPFATNIFCGLLINFKIAKGQITNFGEFKRTNNLGFYSTVISENTQDYGLLSSTSSGNGITPNSFSLYIKPNLGKNKLRYYSDVIKGLYSNAVFQFQYTFMLYNNKLKSTIVYSVSFTSGTINEVTFSKYVQGFKSFVNNQSGTLITLIVINLIYLVGFIYIVFLFVRSFSHHLIDLIKSQKYSFEWYDWIDLIVLLICFISQIMFYNIYLFNGTKFPIQISNPADFNYWLGFSQQIKAYNNITGLAIFFIMIRLIRILHTTFPNFGIVLQTLSLASNELMAFLLLSVLLVSGSAMMSYFQFGWYSPSFMYVGDTLMTIFLLLIGNTDYSVFTNSNAQSTLTPYFYLFFVIFFNLVLINVFLLTIRNNYADVKEFNHKYNEAYTLMIADKSNDFQKKLVNFLICGDPTVHDEKDSKVDKDKETEEELQKRRERERNISKIPIWTRARLNFEKLNIRQLIFGGNAWTREEFEKNKKEKYKEIELNALISSISDLEVDYEKEFDQLSDTIIYILYIVLFVVVIFLQIKLNISGNSDVFLRAKFGQQFSNLSSVTKVEDIPLSLNILFQNLYFRNFTEEPNRSLVTLDPFILNDYVFLQPPYFRLNFRVYSMKQNTDTSDNNYFQWALPNPSYVMDVNSCGSINEKTDPLGYPNYPNFTYPYTMSGGFPPSPASCGGYVFLLNSTNPYYTTGNATLNYTVLDSILRNVFIFPIGLAEVDFVVANYHYNTLTYIKMSLTKTVVGQMLYNCLIFTVPINLYSHNYDYIRMFFEIVYLFLFLYYVYIQLGSIFAILTVYLENDFESDPEKEKYRNSNYLLRYLRIDLRSHENDTIFQALLFYFWKVCERGLMFIFYFVSSTIDYLKANVYNVLDLISFFLSWALIGVWFQIVGAEQKTDFTFTQDVSNFSKLTYLISNTENLYNLSNNYVTLAAVNIFVNLIRMIRLYRFSKPIYNLVQIIDLAKNTVIFHLIFVFVIYFGFAIWGFSLYGQVIQEFSSIQRIVLELFTILSGDVNYITYVQIEPIWSFIYVILYSLIVTIILFNILTAIIVETYKEIKHRQEQNSAENVNKNFLATVYNIIENKYHIFINTSAEYFEELERTYKKHLKSLASEDDSPVVANEDFGSKIENFINDTRHKLEVRLIETDKLEKIALKILPKHAFEKNLSPEEEKKLIEEQKNVLKDVSTSTLKKIKKITNLGCISIFARIFMYIIYNLKLDDPLFEIQDLNIVNENDDDGIRPKKPAKNAKPDEYSKKDENEEVEKDNVVQDVKIPNKFQTEFVKHYKDIFGRRILKGFLKIKLFEKEKKLKLNKKSQNHVQYHFSHMEYYQFKIPKKNRLYNIDFVVNCYQHRHEKRWNLSCDSCNYNYEYLHNSYVFVYDLLVKYFYVPEKISHNEKETYIGYYLYQYLKNGEDDMNFKPKCIFESKMNFILRDLQFISSDEFETAYYSEDSVFRISEKAKKHSSKEKTKKPVEMYEIPASSTKLFDDKNDETSRKSGLIKEETRKTDLFHQEILMIYKKYVIWNSIYLILLKKYAHFVKEIKEKSISYNLIAQLKKKSSENEYYKEFFIKIFNLYSPEVSNNNENNQENQGQVYDALKQKLREYITKTAKDISQFDLSVKSFYESDNKYMIDEDNLIDDLEDIIPKEAYYNQKSDKDEKNQVDLLISIWNGWETQEKFYIFFGFNINFKYVLPRDFKKFLLKGFLEKDTEFKIYQFFNNTQRAEILKSLAFPQKFVKVLLKKMKEFRDKVNIADNGSIFDVNSFQDLLKYIGEMKINYIKYYDFIINHFDKCFRQMRKIVRTVDMKYAKIFNFSKFTAYNNNYSMYEYVPLFKLFISYEKYIELRKLYDDPKKINFNDSFNGDQDIEEEDQMKPEKIIAEIELQQKLKREAYIGEPNPDTEEKGYHFNENKMSDQYENIILSFTLDPFELIDVIRYIDDDNLREFYMILMIYINEDNDFTNVTEYLEREFEFTVLQKYKSYSNYLLEKDNVLKLEERYKFEKSYFSYIINYSKFLKEKVEKMVDSRDKDLNLLKQLAENDITKLNEKSQKNQI